MKTDIFIASYSGDLGWLAYCLKSCQKFAKGFNQIHVVVPKSELHLFSHLTSERVHGVDPIGPDGYNDQQSRKLHSDQISDADYICHIDSDTIWGRDVTPEDLILNGKPIILFEEGIETHWSPIVEKALGWPLKADYMRRSPHVFPRWVYGEFRKWMEEKHGVQLNEYIARQPFMQFTEYNCLGSLAWEAWHDSFEWRHPSEMGVFTWQGRQHGRWGPNATAADASEEIEGILKKEIC